jgi:RNA polymerase sigma-70 factor (ECF subfamily)
MTVQALRERHVGSLTDLLEAHGREIQAVAYLILRDRALAEDVTIETLLTAFERGGSIRDDAALRAWLLRVATNRALSVRRSTDRVVELESAAEPTVSPDFAREAVDRVVLLGAVGELPIQMRAAVVLRYYADLPVEAVAEALGKSPNTIKAQLQTALEHLRLAMSEPAANGTEISHA